MKKILVTSCNDKHRWYADFIGRSFDMREDGGRPERNKEWKVVTDRHTTNFIQFEDGVEIGEDVVIMADGYSFGPGEEFNKFNFDQREIAEMLYLSQELSDIVDKFLTGNESQWGQLEQILGLDHALRAAIKELKEKSHETR